MESIVKLSNKKSLNISKELILFLGLDRATILTLMMEKIMLSTSEGRVFKLKLAEAKDYTTKHTYKKIVKEFEAMGLIRVEEDVMGVQVGLNYHPNLMKFEEICKIALEGACIDDFKSYIKDVVRENLDIEAIKSKIKMVKGL